MRRCILALVAVVCFAPNGMAGTEPVLRYAFKPGSRLEYVQSYRSKTLSDARALFQAGTDGSDNDSLVMDLQMDLRGRMIILVADRDPQGFLLLVHWEGLRGGVTANSQNQSSFLEAIRKGLAEPVLVRMDDQGRIVALWLDPDLDPGVQGTARMLLAEIQCVLPTGAESAWKTTELDASGTFEVRYELDPATPKNGLTRIWKHLAQYLPSTDTGRPLSSNLKVERSIEVEGARQILFNPLAGRLERLEAREIHRTNIAQKLVAASDTRFALRRSRTSRSDARASAKAKLTSADLQLRYPATELFVVIGPQQQEEAVQRKELGASTIEELFATLNTAETQGLQDEGPLYLKFKAVALIHPDTCSTMGELLANANPEGLSMRLLASVLGVTGSPQAQQALADAIRRRREDWPAQAFLLPALGQCAEPSTASINLLEELAYNSLHVPIASTAQLMLGTMAFNLARQGKPEKAAVIVESALSRLSQSTSVPLTTRYLLCLGNAGSLSALPALQTWISNSDAELRASAIYALRWIEAPEVDPILLHALDSDPAPEVRLKAIDALKFRNSTGAVVSALKGVVIGDASPRVRLAALGNLWDLRSTFPDVLPAVEAACKDSDEDIRNLAESMLGKK